MGILDRLRAAARPAPPSAPASAAAPEADGTSGRPPGWAALPRIERATAQPARHTVATADFSRSLATWRNPSFMGTLSHAVLDAAPAGLIHHAVTPVAPRPGRGTASLGEPALALPVVPAAPADGTVRDEASGIPMQSAIRAALPTGLLVAPAPTRSAPTRQTPLTRAVPAVQRRVPAITAPAPAPAGTSSPKAPAAGADPTSIQRPVADGPRAAPASIQRQVKRTAGAPAATDASGASATTGASGASGTSAANNAPDASCASDASDAQPPAGSVPTDSDAATSALRRAVNRHRPGTRADRAAAAPSEAAAQEPVGTARSAAGGMPPAAPGPAANRRATGRPARSALQGPGASPAAPGPVASPSPAAPVRHVPRGPERPAPGSAPSSPVAPGPVAAQRTAGNPPRPGPEGTAPAASGRRTSADSVPPAPRDARPSPPANGRETVRSATMPEPPQAGAVAQSAAQTARSGQAGGKPGGDGAAPRPPSGLALQPASEGRAACGPAPRPAPFDPAPPGPRIPSSAAAPSVQRAAGEPAPASPAPVRQAAGDSVRSGTGDVAPLPSSAAAGPAAVQRAAAQSAPGTAPASPAASPAGASGAPVQRRAARLGRSRRGNEPGADTAVARCVRPGTKPPASSAASASPEASGQPRRSALGAPLTASPSGATALTRPVQRSSAAGPHGFSGAAVTATAPGPSSTPPAPPAPLPTAGIPAAADSAPHPEAAARWPPIPRGASATGEAPPVRRLPAAADAPPATGPAGTGRGVQRLTRIGAAAGQQTVLGAQPGSDPVTEATGPPTGSARPLTPARSFTLRAAWSAPVAAQRPSTPKGVPLRDATGPDGAGTPSGLRAGTTENGTAVQSSAGPAAPQRLRTGSPAAPGGPAPVQRTTAAPDFAAAAEPQGQGRLRPAPLAPAVRTPPAPAPVRQTPGADSSSARTPARSLVPATRPAEPRPAPAVVPRMTTAPAAGGGTASAGPPPAGTEAVADPPPRTGYDPRQVTEAFDVRMLKDDQVDELAHSLINPLVRLLRAELRLDRERIGRLRDQRR